jgi:hypothetical protein
VEACGYSVKSGREGRSRESPFLFSQKEMGGAAGWRHERSTISSSTGGAQSLSRGGLTGPPGAPTMKEERGSLLDSPRSAMASRARWSFRRTSSSAGPRTVRYDTDDTVDQILRRNNKNKIVDARPSRCLSLSSKEKEEEEETEEE